MRRHAHEIELIETVPKIKLLKIAPQKFDLLTFDELSRLLDAAKPDSARFALLATASHAGLRHGELIALERRDLDLVVTTLTVRRSWWQGIVGAPMSGRARKIWLTAPLGAALKAHRHPRRELVFCHDDGNPLTESAIKAALRYARASVRGYARSDRTCSGTPSVPTSRCGVRRRRRSRNSRGTRR